MEYGASSVPNMKQMHEQLLERPALRSKCVHMSPQEQIKAHTESHLASYSAGSAGTIGGHRAEASIAATAVHGTSLARVHGTMCVVEYLVHGVMHDRV